MAERLVGAAPSRTLAAHVTHSDDDEIERGDDPGVLAAGAGSEVRLRRQIPGVNPVQPEQSTVLGATPRRSGSTDKLHPALGQNALAPPHAILQIQHSNPGPIARGAVVVTGDQEVAVR